MSYETKPKQPWTPGPWEVFGGRLIRSTDGEVATSLAETIMPYRRGIGPVHGREEEHANGVLIARAPAMAAMLAKFVLGYDDALRRRGDRVAPVDPPVIAAARAELDLCGWRWS